ncbi:unnamed protein product [Notodromas monacha]|uniref:Serine/threonine-protein phosphatase 2A activator n=1 Tax=Notodromas monacha TaxID=399045 RepID=A0A7R9GB63_9CRUS|nr:unnamed protein product [Notodromas monacha]CAG0916006.1 unnamed protein product [Notodromas monacha]
MASPTEDLPLPAIPCMRGIRRGGPLGGREHVKIGLPLRYIDALISFVLIEIVSSYRDAGDPVGSEHKYVLPTKKVTSADQMALWEKSDAYHKINADPFASFQEYVGFILALNDSVTGKSLSTNIHVSEATTKTLAILDTLSTWIDEIPPINQPQRFGNKAFRDFYARAKERCRGLIESHLPDSLKSAAEEVSLYLEEGLGNATRIDYGTGHEMSFVMFMCTLFRIGFLSDEDRAAAVLKIFAKYLELARKLQRTYMMEPAGSHGVWSLDDFQFIPFIWGSAQLINHPKLEPRSFTNADTAEAYAHDYLLMSCIKYINDVKTGPFAEHSNQLWHISGVPTWTKVNQGLMKMYKAEVLAKFPVIQHTFFGSLFKLEPCSELTGRPKSTGMAPPRI